MISTLGKAAGFSLAETLISFTPLAVGPDAGKYAPQADNNTVTATHKGSILVVKRVVITNITPQGGSQSCLHFNMIFRLAEILHFGGKLLNLQGFHFDLAVMQNADTSALSQFVFFRLPETLFWR